jgi:preprotein translocase subunit SecE
MNPNRKWIALGYLFFAVVLWVLTDKFLTTVMSWAGILEYNFEIPSERFTLTTLIGLLVASGVGFWAWRHPTLSTLSNEVAVELRKVTWPTAAETRAATIVVIVTVFIMSIFLGLFDMLWSKLLNLLYPSMHST